MPHNQTISKLCQFLESETRRIERSTRTFYIVSTGALVAFIVYMSVVFSMVTNILESQTLATILQRQIEKHIPTAIADAKEALTQDAPAFADRLSHNFLRNIPNLRAQAEHQIQKTYEYAIPRFGEKFGDFIESYIESHKAELITYAENHSAEEFNLYFSKAMMEGLNDELEGMLMTTDSTTKKMHFTSMAIYAALKEHLNNPKSQWEQGIKQKLFARLLLTAILEGDYEPALDTEYLN